MDSVKAFREAKMGLMLHFGLYSLLAGTYRGKRGPKYAEWIQSYFQIPNREIESLAQAFNPVYFDAEEICAFAMRSGMKYLVATAKHHEGFALFHSEADSFNAVDFAPFRRDLILELAKACRKYGLKFGVYYSQVIDWHEKHGGGYLTDPKGAAGVSWENSWDFPEKSEKEYELCFRKKILPQIRELLTNYGELFTFWFDMPLDSSAQQSEEIYRTVKELQPECLVNSRLGNGFYDFVSLGDDEIPDRIPSEICFGGENEINGFKPSKYGLYESACTLNGSWGYTTLDQNFKSAEEILENRRKLESLGINYLINVGLDPLGRIPIPAAECLEEVQKRYHRTC